MAAEGDEEEDDHKIKEVKVTKRISDLPDVLKANATFPDKSPNAGSSVSEKQPTEASQFGASHRIAFLRQLSNSIAQFNNLQSPLRSRRPVTRKEAAVINEWRFKKLNEYKEGLTQQEIEAFDRYM